MAPGTLRSFCGRSLWMRVMVRVGVLVGVMVVGGAEMVVLICVTISEQLTNLRLATLVTSKVHK